MHIFVALVLLQSGCVTRDVMWLKHPALSWTEQWTSSIGVNVGDRIKINLTLRLETDS